MTSKERDISEMVPLNSVVKQAILDTYGQYVDEEARFTAWAIRGLKKLTRQTLKSNKRYAILNVNKNLRQATLPCDFKEEIFVGIINSCGEKIALNINQNIVNVSMIDEVPCENECAANCGCFPKQLCEDLTTTQVINKIRIGDTDYDETVTSTLLPNGEYKVVTTTPFLDTVNSGIIYKDKTEYVTTFDVADCGCIERTERNICRLENICFDLYCCYCTCCNTTNTDFGGYRIFKENNIIKFDTGMTFDKVYLEYRGFLPKSGNEYLVPEVAFEVLVNFSKFKSVENKRGVSRTDRDWHWERYRIEYDNMRIVLGRIPLSDIIHAALTVPTFDYNTRKCSPSSPSSSFNTTKPTVVTNTVYVPAPSASLPSIGCNPAIITTNGQEMENGTTYHNSTLIGVPFRVFANAFNRMLHEDEYVVLSTGGFRVLTGVYTLIDEFDIYPKWCDANVADIPASVVMGARKLVIKVDGIAGSPVNGQFTYQNNTLIGATVEDIIVNKTMETAIDGDFTFDTSTGTIARTNQWIIDDTAIINYIK